MEIARSYKARRVSGGGIELEGVEVQVLLDDSKNIEDLVPKKVNDMSSFFMLFKRVCKVLIL
jgi:hypothetical protein